MNEAALNLLKSQSASDRLATELREKIDSAAAQLDNGKGLNPEDVFAGLRAKLRTDNPWLAFSAWDNKEDDIYAQLLEDR